MTTPGDVPIAALEPLGWPHLTWFAREFRRGFLLDVEHQELGLASRTALDHRVSRKAWTTQIKNVAHRLAQPDVAPFSSDGRPQDWACGFGVSASSSPHRRTATGEFLFDVCWHTYRRPGEMDCDYGECAARRSGLRVELALESEFGKRTSRGTSMSWVLDDFGKLREARARLKVLVYRHHDAHAEELLALLQRLADEHPIRVVPADSYLLIRAPWTETAWRPERREELWQFVGRAGDGPWRALDAARAAFV